MVLGAHAFHGLVVIDQVVWAVCAGVSLSIIELPVSTDGAVHSVEVGISGRAVCTLLQIDIVHLLNRAFLALHIPIVPVIRVFTLHANFFVPI